MPDTVATAARHPKAETVKVRTPRTKSSGMFRRKDLDGFVVEVSSSAMQQHTEAATLILSIL